jgi:hypothetical protein
MKPLTMIAAIAAGIGLLTGCSSSSGGGGTNNTASDGDAGGNGSNKGDAGAEGGNDGGETPGQGDVAGSNGDANAGMADGGSGVCYIASDGECQIGRTETCDPTFGDMPMSQCPTANLLGCCTYTNPSESMLEVQGYEVCLYPGQGDLATVMGICSAGDGTFTATPQ